MPDLEDGESIEMQGSGSKPYVLKNVGGVYSCTCPAWRNQSVGHRTAHLQAPPQAPRRRRRGGPRRRRTPARPARTRPPPATKRRCPGSCWPRSWDNATDLSGWWMSEKLDGVRAYWDGKQFLSRQGNLFHAPDWFVPALPDQAARRRTLDRTARSSSAPSASSAGRTRAISGRKSASSSSTPPPDAAASRTASSLSNALATAKAKYARPHEHELCKDRPPPPELARVESLGGEGLMLRQPGSKYEAGRSSTLLKVKTFHDAEARVIGHQPGAGRHKGRLGALVVDLPNGTQFSVGTGFSDAERDTPADRPDHHLPLPGTLRRRRAALPQLRRRPRRAVTRCATLVTDGVDTGRTHPSTFLINATPEMKCDAPAPKARSPPLAFPPPVTSRLIRNNRNFRSY